MKQKKNLTMSFEAWNKQFGDNRELDEFIPEYDCTLKEYRLSIYKAEMDDDEISMDEFKEKMKSWR